MTVIVEQPSNQTVAYNTAATLSVVAAGNQPSYQWYKGATGDTSSPISGATSASFTTPALISNTNYWVRIVSDLGVANSNTARVAVSFTDNVLSARSTVIRAAHITELRARIDALRVRYGLSPYSYTDPAITVGITVVKAAHLTDMRRALQDVYSSAGLAQPTYTTNPTPSGTSVIGDILDLRSAVLAIE
jgi:hypothetical protein